MNTIAAKGRPALVVGRRYRVWYRERRVYQEVGPTHAAILTFSGHQWFGSELEPLFSLSPDDPITLPGLIQLLDWEELLDAGGSEP